LKKIDNQFTEIGKFGTNIFSVEAEKQSGDLKMDVRKSSPEKILVFYIVKIL